MVTAPGISATRPRGGRRLDQTEPARTSDGIDQEGAPTIVIHLDTNILIRMLIPGSVEDARVTAWMAAAEPLGISAIVWAEFSRLHPVQ